eukprot:TRINITY_DN14622_c0_g1_i4.p1 TRINITY_DN14622_c0_g1~~TRINITY_DN14622_c0_g1_i4.p1  ORF type:complete len:381 (+),score=126.12 TRINITY_DN14622_c0_g1_i4:660-1802(+)
MDRKDPDGSGNFLLDPKSLDSFGRAPAHITNAYILWALTAPNGDSSIIPQITKELDHLLELARGEYKNDAYFVGLASLVMHQTNKLEESLELATALAKLQILQNIDDSKPIGSVDLAGSSTTITSSRGNSLQVETVSVAALAWMNHLTTFNENVVKAIDLLNTKCENGRFSSTQATVMALKAIIAFDMATSSPSAAGSIGLSVNNVEIERIMFSPDQEGALVFDTNKILKSLVIGEENKMELTMDSSSDGEPIKMPYSIMVTSRSNNPASATDLPVKLNQQLRELKFREGMTRQLSVTVTNESGKDLGMILAIIGIPGGLELRHDRLRELIDGNEIAFYEVRGRELALYWREMQQDAEYNLLIDVIAKVNTKYTLQMKCY